MSLREEYLLRSADDFVRLDRACHELLKEFARWLQTRDDSPLAAEAAGAFAHAADRYLRDFVVDIMESGPADVDPTLVQKYLANWYAVNTLTPTHDEVDRILSALRELHRFLPEHGILPAAAAETIGLGLRDAEYFHQRLEDFWNLTPEGIDAWRAVHDYRNPRRN